MVAGLVEVTRRTEPLIESARSEVGNLEAREAGAQFGAFSPVRPMFESGHYRDTVKRPIE
jgi:hypothetical protein